MRWLDSIWLNGREPEQTGRQWRIGKPGVLPFMGLQRGGCGLEADNSNIAYFVRHHIKAVILFFKNHWRCLKDHSVKGLRINL